MALSELDSYSALLIIDLQKGIVGLPAAHPIDPIVANSAQLARAFRSRGLPVVLVNVAGGAPGRIERSMNMTLPPDWTELVPELEAHPDDYRVTKHRWGAFHGTSLDAFLRERGVTQVVLTGVATSMGVESTARNAHEHGYNVALVVDAMTDLDIEAHRHSVEKIFPLLGETTTTAEVLTRLDGHPAR